MFSAITKRRLLGGIAAACALPAMPVWAQTGRAVVADMARITGPRDMAWQDCVGSGHAGLLLRAANQEQLRLIHDEIGFQYVRFHGIFADDTQAYRDVDGKPVYDFSKTDAVYEAVLKAGMKPFVEVGFMPKDLAANSRTIFYWNGHGTQPKDWNKWYDFIVAFTRHLQDRFGKDEVRSWRFEIWNEPNLDGFWTGGDLPSYLKLYDTTVGAIKSVDAALKVGGPATAGGLAWVPQLLDHAKATGVPIDFITTHTYGVAGGFLDEKGEGDNKLIADPNSVSYDVLTVRKQIAKSAFPHLPLYFTEWSTSYSPRDPVHDDYLSAAFILDKLKKTEGAAQSMSYWVYSDLFEEAGPPPASFHGGFGLLNREGIRKAAFFAYKYLNALGPHVLAGADARSILSRKDGNFAGLFWDYTTPDQPESNRPFFRKLRRSTAVGSIDLTVEKLAPGTYRLRIYRTGFQANDAYSQYIAWGLPRDLSAEQIAVLQNLSKDLPETETTVFVGPNGAFRHSLAMRANDVVLVKLERDAS